MDHGNGIRQLASTSKEYLKLLEGDSTWLIRSQPSGLDLREREPLFLKLSDEEISAFTRGMIFKNNGLAHANYEVLSKHLSADEIATVFAHFGISPELLAEYQDKKCTGPATCSSSLFDVCTSNC